jgi:hypothetical protein
MLLLTARGISQKAQSSDQWDLAFEKGVERSGEIISNIVIDEVTNGTKFAMWHITCPYSVSLLPGALQT